MKFILPSLTLLSLIFSGCGGYPSTPPTITLTTTLFGGALSITGTVSMPDTALPGRGVSIQVWRIDGPGGSQSAQGVTTTNAKTVLYQITGLVAGSYQVLVNVDQTNDGQIGSGDIGGYYNGTVANPILLRTSSTAIPLTSSSVSAIDFGIGFIP